MIDVASLNRRVTISRRTLVDNPNGFNSTENWLVVRKIWAALKYDSADTVLAVEQAYARRVVTFTTLFIRDLTEIDRLSYEGTNYRILGITESGFREALEIKAEAIDPDGV